MKVYCEKCDEEYDIYDVLLGPTHECEHCGTKLTVLKEYQPVKKKKSIISYWRTLTILTILAALSVIFKLY